MSVVLVWFGWALAGGLLFGLGMVLCAFAGFNETVAKIASGVVAFIASAFLVAWVAPDKASEPLAASPHGSYALEPSNAPTQSKTFYIDNYATRGVSVGVTCSEVAGEVTCVPAR